MLSDGRPIGYILRSYPRLSQTFILNEILALERRGLRLQIFACTNPRESVVQRQVAEVSAPVHYLDVALQRGRAAILADHLQVLIRAPRRYLSTALYVLKAKQLEQAYTASSRFECFHQAVYIARLLLDRTLGIRHLHAHFAHDPALIAYLVHTLTGISFSFTAHARDLYQIPRSALVERATAASAVVTCCGANADYLRATLPQPLHHKIQLIYHGVDLEGFSPASHSGEADGPPLILSVGRLVEKKGFSDLLLACSRLQQAGYRFRCAIYGDGPLQNELSQGIEQLGLRGIVTLEGAIPQRELVPVFQRADLFVLAPFVTDDGDRDGVPNVLVEAMACGLPVVSTAVAGIPELVRHGYNGLLVGPRNAEELAEHLGLLLADEPQRRRLGANARQTVVEHFNLRRAAERLERIVAAQGKGEEQGTRSQNVPNTA